MANATDAIHTTTLAAFLGKHSTHSNHSNAMDVMQATTAMDDIQTTTAMPLDPVLQIMSEETFATLHLKILPWFRDVIGSLGVINNILTLIVFSKMGFKETANITLTAIAFWDLIASIGIFLPFSSDIMDQLIQNNLSFTYSYRYIMISVKKYIGASVYVSIVLAAYLAIERCLCVTMPFAVKHLLTRKFVTLTCGTISVVVSGSFVLQLATKGFITIHIPSQNISFIYYPYPTQLYWDNRLWIDRYHYAIRQLYPAASLVVTSVCTVIIVFQLRKSSKLRSKMNANASTLHQLSSRDIQITKMLVVVILVFMVYAFPMVVTSLVLAVNPLLRYGYLGKVFMLLNKYNAIVAAFNGAVNIYIYFFMSSGFNHTLKELFCIPVLPMKAKNSSKGERTLS